MSYFRSRSNTWNATTKGVEAIKQKLHDKGWPHHRLCQEVSKNINLSSSTLSRFLKGNRIDSEVVQAICEVLDLDMNTIVQRQNKPVEIKHQIDEDNIDISRSILFEKLETMPDISGFSYRKNELKSIIHEISDYKNLIVVSGSPGVGKSYLIAKVLEIIKQQKRFEGYIWKSVRYGVKVKDLLNDIINLIPSSDKFKTDSNYLTDEGISKFIELLNYHKIFLVLENWEDLFKNNEISGYYKDEYEKYNYLLEKLTDTETQSCVIVTTSQKPKNLALPNL